MPLATVPKFPKPLQRRAASPQRPRPLLPCPCPLGTLLPCGGSPEGRGESPATLKGQRILPGRARKKKKVGPFSPTLEERAGLWRAGPGSSSGPSPFSSLPSLWLPSTAGLDGFHAPAQPLPARPPSSSSFCTPGPAHTAGEGRAARGPEPPIHSPARCPV